MTRRLRTAGLALALLLAACSRGAPAPREVAPSGPPTVAPDTIDRHERQLEQMPRRTAGSEAELVAATYILGHLQLAGYAVRLDSVPVANTVNSTNVVAVPPQGRRPEILVAAAYDGGPGDRAGNEAALGLFLELARALRVAKPAHSVEFAALGAEHATVSGGHLGSRRMVELLRAQGPDVFVVVLDGTSPQGPLVAEGDRSELLAGKPTPAGAALDPAALETAAVFRRAGYETLVAGGGEEALARALLRMLIDEVG